MKLKIVFVGNAQANALHAAWRKNIAGTDNFDNRFVHYSFVSDADKAAIEAADVIIQQISDLETYDAGSLRPGVRIIRYPYVTGSFLWPYCGPGHPDWGTTLMHEYGVFNGELGDGYLARLHRDGIPAREAIERYANLDIVSAAKIERRYEICLDLQRLRDQKSGLDLSMADYIEKNISQEILFTSRQQLAKPIFWYLARNIFRQLLRFLGDDETKAEEGEYLGYLPHWGRLEMPVHPNIARHFALPGITKYHEFRINLNRLTFDQYTRDYMNGVFQSDLYAGMHLLQRRSHEAALPPLLRGFAAAPRSPDAASMLGQAYSGLGRDGEALEMACAAVHLDIGNRGFLLDLAQRYRQRNFNEAARVALERALEIDPYDPETIRALCDILVLQENPGRAIALARDLATKIPHHAFVHHRLGQLLLAHNELAGAKQSLHTAITLNAGDHWAHGQLAEILSRQGQGEEAIALLLAGITEATQCAEALGRLGTVSWRCDQLLTAERAFEAAIRLAPGVSSYKLLLADLLAVLGRVEEAIALARGLTDRGFDQAQIYDVLGRLYWRRGDLDAAVEAFRTAIARDPDNEKFRLHGSMVLAARGEPHEAITLMGSSIADGSGDPAMHTHLGEMYARTGDADKAETSFRRALSLDKHHERATSGLQAILGRRDTR